MKKTIYEPMQNFTSNQVKNICENFYRKGISAKEQAQRRCHRMLQQNYSIEQYNDECTKVQRSLSLVINAYKEQFINHIKEDRFILGHKNEAYYDNEFEYGAFIGCNYKQIKKEDTREKV